ncbi:ImmA/IrrE family metallo-endopeptidase [uncultured Microbacterium sp.]|uniref:ImmA/IrrE family metallo-endopeptidase n=1 Tax=uncultured Microbacterium sp. TaxID=191216 RepID=UPI0025DEA984|nr:ImmA/IrrE family metallo-endopeptidase [uncultured Microbacterium sp.]
MFELIEASGYTVEYVELSPDRDGETDHDRKVVSIQFDLSLRPYRSTIAHEACHVVFGDEPSMFGPVNAKQERRADEWAAHQLIDLEEYRQSEAVHEGCVEAMAIDLCVTTDLVEAFRRVLLRTHSAVYVAPRMGAGQFAGRVAVA